jgi:hypothetical protein
LNFFSFFFLLKKNFSSILRLGLFSYLADVSPQRKVSLVGCGRFGHLEFRRHGASAIRLLAFRLMLSLCNCNKHLFILSASETRLLTIGKRIIQYNSTYQNVMVIRSYVVWRLWVQNQIQCRTKLNKLDSAIWWRGIFLYTNKTKELTKWHLQEKSGINGISWTNAMFFIQGWTITIGEWVVGNLKTWHFALATNIFSFLRNW